MITLRCNFCNSEIKLGGAYSIQYDKIECKYCYITEVNWDWKQRQIEKIEKEEENIITSRFEILDIREK